MEFLKPEESEFSRVLKPYLVKLSMWGFYVKNARILNYAFACGVVGVAVNYATYHILNRLLWEPVAFYAAVGVAALSNYALTVGPFGYLLGLSDKHE